MDGEAITILYLGSGVLLEDYQSRLISIPLTQKGYYIQLHVLNSQGQFRLNSCLLSGPEGDLNVLDKP